MKLLLATLAFASCAVLGSATATANPQSPCENGNPTDLCGPHRPPPDTIDVADEPPGANCEFGGVSITHTTYPKPEPVLLRDGEEIIEPPAPPEPVVEVFYVCNGAPGENGEPGAPGAPGTTLPAGLDVSQNVEVNVNIENGGRGNRCRFARTPRLLLPERLRDFDNVRVRVDRAASSALVDGSTIQVRAMRGRKCGPHVVTVRKRGVSPTVRLWTVLDRQHLNRRVLIP